jgi:hypothetical protein
MRLGGRSLIRFTNRERNFLCIESVDIEKAGGIIHTKYCRFATQDSG